MELHKLSTIVYAQGYIEDYVENNTNPIEAAEEDREDESYMGKLTDENNHREEIRAMWKVLSEGLDQLRRENSSLQMKLDLIDMARSTPT